MKLQYYLRGLGIGILVTALIFCLLPGEKEALTDAEIMERALELGMVESSSLTLADIQQKQPEETKPTKEIEPTEEAKPTEEVKPTEEAKPTGEVKPTEEAKSTEEVKPTEEAKPTGEVKPTEETNSTEESQTTSSELVTVTISKGSGSYTVSRLLQDMQLIEDAGAFDKYLVDNGYSRKIRMGSHEIPRGASWKEIADIISGK